MSSCICVCVFMCVGESLTEYVRACACVCARVFVYEHVCAWVCVRVRE